MGRQEYVSHVRNTGYCTSTKMYCYPVTWDPFPYIYMDMSFTIIAHIYDISVLVTVACLTCSIKIQNWLKTFISLSHALG